MHVFFAVHHLQFFHLFDLLVVLSTDTALKPSLSTMSPGLLEASFGPVGCLPQ